VKRLLRYVGLFIVNVMLLGLVAISLLPLWRLARAAFGGASLQTWNVQSAEQLLIRGGPDGQSVFGLQLLNSALVSLSVTLIVLVLATPAAYGMMRLNFPLRRSVRGLMWLVLVAPVTAVLIAGEQLLALLGLRDSLLAVVGWQLALTLPVALWILCRAFDRLPVGLEEMARLEGASPSRVFRRIVLPRARPWVWLTAAVVFVISWGDYVGPSTLLARADVQTASGALVGAARYAALPPDQFAAAMVIAGVPAMMAAWFLQRRLGLLVRQDQ